VLDTKGIFFEVWHRGGLGSKLRSWRAPQFVPKEKGLQIMLRAKGGPGGSLLAHWVSRPRLEAEWLRMQERFPGVRWELNECAPDETSTLQGEIVESPTLDLFAYERPSSRIGELLRMRDILPLASRYQGLMAKQLLKRHLWPASYDDLMELLDLFPEHVVEFSAYSRACGWAKQRNTLIWECRRY
jgi:hypothetical protein